MTDSPESPQEPALPRKPDDYEDTNYHDDDEIVPSDDAPHPVRRLPTEGKPRRRIPPPRRRFSDD